MTRLLSHVYTKNLNTLRKSTDASCMAKQIDPLKQLEIHMNIRRLEILIEDSLQNEQKSTVQDYEDLVQEVSTLDIEEKRKRLQDALLNVK